MTLGTDRDEDTTKWGLIGTIIWGIVVFAVFAVVQLFAMGIYIGIKYRQVDIADMERLMKTVQYDGMAIAISTIATFLVCSGLILIIIKFKKGSNIKAYLGLKGFGPKTALNWVLVLIGFIVLSDTLTILLNRPVVPEFMATAFASCDNLWLLWVALIVAAPIFEELFVRGFLLSGLSSSIIGATGAVLVTSLAWAAIHLQYDLFYMTIIFILGVGLGFARLKSGSVLLTIGLHAFSNLVATIETVLTST